MICRIERKGDCFKLYINDFLHLLITDRITSLQSWNEENRFYKVEIQTKDNSTILEYDSQQKWEQILKEFDKIL